MTPFQCFLHPFRTAASLKAGREALLRRETDNNRLRASLAELQRLVGSEIGKMVVEEIGHMMARELHIKIGEAVMAVRANNNPITLSIPVETLRFMDPKSIEREVLARYAEQSLPRLSLRAMPDPSASITMVDITVPALGIRRAVMN